MRVRSAISVAESRTRPQFNPNTNAPDRHCGGIPCVLFLGRDPYERLTSMAQRARANGAQFLKHLILRAEAIYNFQLSLPPSRPWWKLWSKELVPELPAIVADLRNAPTG